jgi:hypothetical protein
VEILQCEVLLRARGEQQAESLREFLAELLGVELADEAVVRMYWPAEGGAKVLVLRLFGPLLSRLQLLL